jgi:hypothetical protein
MSPRPEEAETAPRPWRGCSWNAACRGARAQHPLACVEYLLKRGAGAGQVAHRKQRPCRIVHGGRVSGARDTYSRLYDLPGYRVP